MAFRSSKRKEFKKSSYYVWFLGAKESKGLRGDEFILPVVRPAIEREKELEPMKITLQISHKGMKIVQTVPKKTNKNKTEQIKHFIPHHAITCVLQESEPDDDVVACILLIFNPVTKCPVHVHTYRCDSAETAAKLKNQLELLVSRPENQKKFREIENRLAAKGLIPGLTRRTLNSDGRSTRTDDSSDSGGGHASDKDLGLGASPTQINSLYDSLAAELREKLGKKNNAPILLPPKDYDTVCRKQGRLMNINDRRCKQTPVVGRMGLLPPTPSKIEHDPSFTSDKDRGDCSGKSSGIGSDEALSSAIQEVSSHPDFESKIIDPDTSSDEEDWVENDAEPVEDTPIVQQPVPRDEVFVQKSWRRQPPPISRNKSLPTYHFSDAEVDANRGRYTMEAADDNEEDLGVYHRPTHSSIEYKEPKKSLEKGGYKMYPDNERYKDEEEMRPVYMTRAEFERLERQRATDLEASKRHPQRNEPVRRHSENSRFEEDQSDPHYRDHPPRRQLEYNGSIDRRFRDDEEEIRGRMVPREDVRYRRPNGQDLPAGKPLYSRNKSPAKGPSNHRHSHIERGRPSEHNSNERVRPGYEIRQSNSLHQLGNPEYDWEKSHSYHDEQSRALQRVPHRNSDQTPERKLVHSSTLERFPAHHEKFQPKPTMPHREGYGPPERRRSPSEIPGLVDPRRNSVHLDNFGDNGKYYRSKVDGRQPPRYQVTSAQKF